MEQHTRDGIRVIFVVYNGDICPSGFLPLRLGNVRKDNIVDVYRNSELLNLIKAGELNGKCGIFIYLNICGGSRARAYAVYRDQLAEDPACPY